MIMVMHTLLTTKKCKNNCVICATASPIVPNFYPIGKTETERKAIQRLYHYDVGKKKIMGIDGSLTGGDPLCNLNALEAVAELSREDGTRRDIVVNPISFQKMNDEERERALDLLKEFEVVCSYGDPRGSYPGENKTARLKWKELSAQYGIVNREHFSIDSKLEKTCDGLQLNKDEGIGVVGRLRREIERGRITAPVHYPGTLGKDICLTSRNRMFFFEKIDEKVMLAMSLCCGVGMNKYLTHGTDLSVDDLAGINDSVNVYCAIANERDKFLLRKLGCLISPSDWYGGAKLHLRRFDAIARDLIKKKTGEKIDNILATTPTMQKEVLTCEYCHSIALALHKAGISRNEFHDYVEKRGGM